MIIPISAFSARPDAGNFPASVRTYCDRNWSVFPVSRKTPIASWKERQSRRLTEAECLEAFAQPSVDGIAVVTGAVSGGLAVRDFDDADAYQEWASTHLDQAERTPTARTGRGYHCYGRLPAEVYHKFPDGSGELIGNSKHYVVLPPSLHPCGHTYRWIVDLPEGSLPPLPDSLLPPTPGAPVPALGMRPDPGKGSLPPPRSPSPLEENISCVDVGTHKTSNVDEGDWILSSIQRAVPERAGVRHWRIFDLVRRLRAVPSLAQAGPFAAEEIFNRWFALASASPMRTKEREESWRDFIDGWNRVRWSARGGTLADVKAWLDTVAPPTHSATDSRENNLLRLSLAAEALQSIAGAGNSFPLGAEVAAYLLDIHKTAAARLLRVLVDAGELFVTAEHDRKQKRAREYRHWSVIEPLLSATLMSATPMA